MIAPRIVSLVVALILTAPIALVAQQEPVVTPGARVRIKAPSVTQDRLVGTVVEMGADTCVLEVEGHAEPLALPLASVMSLEVSRGRGSRVLKGLGIGWAGGVLMGTAIGIASADDDEGIVFGAGAEEEALAWGFVLGIAGASVGALIGSTMKVDRWEEVPLDRLRLSLTPHNTRALTLSVSLRM